MNPSGRRPTALFAVTLLSIGLLTVGSSSRLTANTSALPPGALVPSARERMIARQVGSLLEDNHYSQLKIDDAMSPRVMDKFIDGLDGQRSYFLASDIAEFQPYRLRFDDMIRTGDIEPAYAMFARYQQRNRERIQYALTLLDREPDFTLDESFEFDREKAAWPTTVGELDELWRKRVKNDALSLLLAGKTWAEARDVLRTRYDRVLKRGDQIKPEEVFELFLNSYARTFDPHSNYFSPRNSEEYKIQMSLNYEGIGASLQLVDDYVTIMNLIEGGPAAAAGTLSVNDRITAVGQGKDGALTDVVGWRIDDVVQLIRGKGGTLVRLQILPVGAAPGSPEKIVEFTRGKVTLEAQAARKTLKTIKRGDTEHRIGIINVPGFYSDYDGQRAGDANYRSTTRDVRKLIEELKTEKIDGLVMDLRGNGGGFLPEAQSLTGLFVDRGPVVQVQFSNGQKEVLDDAESGVVYSGPLIVLIDRFSASASEIFAGAIQDYRRGVVVGQRSFGKGTVQNLVPLSRWSARPVNGQLTVTIGKFYRVTGESTQHRGVEPDVELASPINLKDVGESALEDALPWDRIQGADFRALDTQLPSIAKLAMEENARQQRDPDYRWLVSDIAALNQIREQKLLSLNLDKRKAERTRLENDRLDRENSRRSARAETPLKAISELDGSKLPDVVLDQSAEVMVDMLKTTTPAKPAKPRPVTARREAA
ncbi:MAG: tail-specific protease [Gammaproteobacteria bacterium]|mgnify:CR=1 FL=1|jgi:carboxyl-terminal processing protease|nr:tail-specific protease [Gammaproteobacteria bacterium]NBR16575.1 tail-specific protease [Gammaproteobacteria bacterium]NCW56939.1 tail-specific protease [Gammaproteobacteria bacterium]NDF85255.1 tail-specific protease [Gammaproteobacteria bacterium]